MAGGAPEFGDDAGKGAAQRPADPVGGEHLRLQPLHLAVGPRERRSPTVTTLFELARSALCVKPCGPTLVMTGG